MNILVFFAFQGIAFNRLIASADHACRIIASSSRSATVIRRVASYQRARAEATRAGFKTWPTQRTRRSPGKMSRLTDAEVRSVLPGFVRQAVALGRVVGRADSAMLAAKQTSRSKRIADAVAAYDRVRQREERRGRRLPGGYSTTT